MEIIRNEMEEIRAMTPEKDENATTFKVKKQHWLAECKALKTRIGNDFSLDTEVIKKEILEESSVDRGDLSDWYISSVSENSNPVWTEEHLDELFGDFILIPKK